MVVPPSQVARVRSAAGRARRRRPAGPRSNSASVRAPSTSITRRHGSSTLAPIERARVRAVLTQQVRRHVEPIARPPVVPEVLPEVGELQRGAHGIGMPRCRLVAHAGDPQHQPSHRVGGTTAVVEDRVPRLVARRGHVLRERREQVVEQLRIEPAARDRVVHGDERGSDVLGRDLRRRRSPRRRGSASLAQRPPLRRATRAAAPAARRPRRRNRRRHGQTHTPRRRAVASAPARSREATGKFS